MNDLTIKIIRKTDEDALNQYLMELVKNGKLPEIISGKIVFDIKGNITLNPKTYEFTIISE